LWLGEFFFRKIDMIRAPWFLFSWSLRQEKRGPATPPEGLVLKIAERSDEREIQALVARSFGFDQQWMGAYSRIALPLEHRIHQAFRNQNLPGLILMHGPRIIAASCLAVDEHAESHLLSGPCVLPEYRSRGLASVLLAETLHQLQQAQLPAARALCLDGTTACKFVYPKFGSVREPYAQEPFAAQ
jgi:hypothetical protein